MGENYGSCLGEIMFIILFITVAVIRCDQVKEMRKTQEIENMIEFTQKQISHVSEQNDSILNNIKKE